MPKLTKRFISVAREYERGWGSKDFSVCQFDTYEKAEKFASEQNAKNNLPSAPDYYITERVIDTQYLSKEDKLYYESLL